MSSLCVVSSRAGRLSKSTGSVEPGRLEDLTNCGAGNLSTFGSEGHSAGTVGELFRESGGEASPPVMWKEV